MLRSKLMLIVLTVGSVLIIIGVALMTWLLTTEEESSVIKISIDVGESTPVKFEALSLVPGDECEYGVKLEGGNANKFDLKLDFIETGDGTLKNYARVKIVVKGNAVYDELLADALDNENISLSVDLKEDKNTEFQVVYYLPLDVGNEAKNAEAKFGLMLTASNE